MANPSLGSAHVYFPVMRLVRPSLIAAFLVTVACRPTHQWAPAVNLLVVAGDSTFWVMNDTGTMRVRRSPILLAHYGGRFYELYVTDDDRSFYDAVIVGQRIYRRDIVRGDSTLVFEDAEVAGLATEYAKAHPDQQPLGPEDDEAEDPSVVATTETDIVDVVGPFMTFSQSADMDVGRTHKLRETHRSVVDLRTGRIVALRDLAPDSTVEELLRRGRAAAKVAFDSVRRSNDKRARYATTILRDFVFNETSYSLVVGDSGPAVAFLVPGRGARAGGYALSLPPLPVAPGDWWTEVRSTLPTDKQASADLWKGPSVDVLARYDSAGSEALLTVRKRGGKEFAVTRIPTPVQRVHWLDVQRRDTLTLNALARAFDEAAMYSGDARTTTNAAASFNLVALSRRIHSRHRD